MAKNSAELSCLLFEGVSAANAPVGDVRNGQDVFLTPSVVAIEFKPLGNRFDDVKLMIAMEWKLEDKDKNILWIDTFKGQTSMLYEGDFNFDNFYTRLLNDIYSKSFQAVKSSPEIRKYAAQLRATSSEPGKGSTIKASDSRPAGQCSTEVVSSYRDKKKNDEVAKKD